MTRAELSLGYGWCWSREHGERKLPREQCIPLGSRGKSGGRECNTGASTGCDLHQRMMLAALKRLLRVGTVVPSHCGADPMSMFAVVASLVVKARRGIKQGSDSTINNLHVFGTWFPIAATTAGSDETPGVSTLKSTEC